MLEAAAATDVTPATNNAMAIEQRCQYWLGIVSNCDEIPDVICILDLDVK